MVERIKGKPAMKLTRTLRSRDSSTTIKVRIIAPDVVEIRYVKPIPCDWIKETYNLSTLKKAGWKEVK